MFDIWSDMPYRYVARNTSVDPNRNVPMITKSNTKTETVVASPIAEDISFTMLKQVQDAYENYG